MKLRLVAAALCALYVGSWATPAEAAKPSGLGTHAWPNSWPTTSFRTDYRGMPLVCQRWVFDNGYIDRCVAKAKKAAAPKGNVA